MSTFYSVKANSQAGNIRAYVMTTQKTPKLQDVQLGFSKI